jgi:hypothetical protein
MENIIDIKNLNKSYKDFLLRKIGTHYLLMTDLRKSSQTT